jgi:cation:H+ antiporter
LPTPGISNIDVAAMILVTILLRPVMRSGSRLCRLEGALLLLCYVAYIAYLWPK